MNIMGKLNSSTEIIPIQGPSDKKYDGIRGKPIYKQKHKGTMSSYFSDPQIVSRVKQYLEDNKNKVYVDVGEMANELQAKYSEYAKRKRTAFKGLVERAFNYVAQSYGVIPPGSGQGYGSSEEIDSELETYEENTTAPGQQLLSMYMNDSNQRKSSRNSRLNDGDQELINISSDEENNEVADKPVSNIICTRRAAAAAANKKNNVVTQMSELLKGKSSSLTITPTRKNTSHTVNDLTPDISVTPSAMKKRKASSMGATEGVAQKKRKEVNFHEPQVTFEDIGGNQKVLKEVCKLLVHIQHPEVYRQIGVSPPRGFLLHGPPGCGKTLLAQAIAGVLKVPLLKVAAPELVAGVSGESEERIRELFEQAVTVAPSVLFLDEIDAITPHRINAQREMERRIVAQLLSCLDELGEKENGDRVLVIGATNRPDSIDPALRRAGRFDREVCLGIPDESAREHILQVLCRKLKLTPNFSFQTVAKNTPGFVGADLVALTREAAMAAINRVFIDLKNTPPDSLEDEKTNMRIEKEDNKNSFQKDSDSKKDKIEEIDVEDSDKMEGIIILSCSGDINSEKKDEVTKESADQDPIILDDNEKGEDDTSKSDKDMVILEDSETKDDEKPTSNEEVNLCSENKDVISKEEMEQINKMEVSDVENDDNKLVNGIDEDNKASSDIKEEDKTEESSVLTEESQIKKSVKQKEVNSPTLEELLSWLEQPPLPMDKLECLQIEQADFQYALKCVQPSAKREGFATVPDVTWDDIGSLKDIREELQMTIMAPIKYPEQFSELGLSMPTGVLLFGPPGCGKTLLAKAIANEAGINFISVKGPELLNMYVGESERAVRLCFQRARNSAPCVIFFDELDALCPKRSDSREGGASMRVVNQLLTEMDGVETRKGVFLMAASNRPDIIDPAVLRPGRLDKILYVGMPSLTDRIDILRALTKDGTKPCIHSDVSLETIAEKCRGYTGADLAALVREAGVEALKEYIRNPQTKDDLVVTEKHFNDAIFKIRPSVPPSEQKHYAEMAEFYSANCSKTEVN